MNRQITDIAFFKSNEKIMYFNPFDIWLFTGHTGLGEGVYYVHIAQFFRF